MDAEKYGINTLGLFGSYSMDEGRDDSDIDIVIETSKPDPFNLIHIKDELEKILNKTIDIVRNRDNMNPYLKNILKRM